MKMDILSVAGCISLKAPTSLATVGTFTKAASTHLFSDLALLNNVFLNGAKLISTSLINLGSSFQSINE